jgi:Tol biopolymer transport system component
MTTRGFRFSPAGRTIAYLVQKRDGGNGGIVGGSLCLVDVDGKNRRCIQDGAAKRFPLTACWSPDGKRLAVSVWESPADAKPGPVNLFAGTSVVEIIDREGQKERTLELPPAQHHLVLDWR